MKEPQARSASSGAHARLLMQFYQCAIAAVGAERRSCIPARDDSHPEHGLVERD
jgi:hypothetical protein